MPSSYSFFAAGFLTAVALGTGFAGTYMDSIGETFGWVERAPRRPAPVAEEPSPPTPPQPAPSTSGVAPLTLAPEEILERQVRDVGPPLPADPPPADTTARSGAGDLHGVRRKAREHTREKVSETERKTAEAAKPKAKKRSVRKRDRINEPARAYGYAENPYYRRNGVGRDGFGGNGFGRNSFGGSFGGGVQDDMYGWR